MKRILMWAGGIGAAAVIITASPVFASQRSSSAPASIALIGTTGSGGASVQPALGATAWYATSFAGSTKNPVIETDCYQNGVIVFGEVDSVTQVNSIGVLLGGDGSPWLTAGGAASCTSTLESRVFKPSGETVTNLAQTSFSAAG
jgi:hypothetical protein